MKKVLITGASGFVGLHLINYLRSIGLEVWGTVRSDLSGFEKKQGLEWVSLDLSDSTQISNILKMVKPNFIFHLAGQSNVHKSWNEKAATIETNLLGTVRLLEAIKQEVPEAMVLTVGSAEEYGAIKTDNPIVETDMPQPVSPYGISKLAMGYVTKQFARTYGLRCIHVRPFNHIGPGQSLGFVTSDFARQIACIEFGIKTGPLLVGNLESARDFTDVRDIVRAYWYLAQEGKIGEIYNVCNGTAIKISYILNELIKRSNKQIEIVQDPLKYRPLEVPVYIGDNTKIKTDTGWTPSINIAITLDDVMTDWRNRCALK